MTHDQHTASAPLTMTARTPEDLLAAVPVVLGFEPRESLVMLTFGAAETFHARADLPATPDETDQVVASLVGPARQHGVRSAVLIAYSEHGRSAARVLGATRRALERSGVTVLEGLRTDGRRWYVVPGRPGFPSHGVPYDLATHPFAVQAIVDGRVLHRSREELAASVAEVPGEVAGVVTALAALVDRPAPALVEGRWVRALVLRCTRGGGRPDDGEVARLLRAMLDIRVRDAAWSPLRREVAREHVAFWSDVVRRTPSPLLPAPAALLAFSAWLSGDGALAWCALDRCEEGDPAYSLAGLVAEMLAGAVPPTMWEGDFDWTTGLTSPPGALPDLPGLA